MDLIPYGSSCVSMAQGLVTSDVDTQLASFANEESTVS